MKRTGMEAMKEEEEEVKKIRSTMWTRSTSSSAWYPRSTVKEEDVKDVVKEEDVKEEEVKEKEKLGKLQYSIDYDFQENKAFILHFRPFVQMKSLWPLISWFIVEIEKQDQAHAGKRSVTFNLFLSSPADCGNPSSS